MAEAAPAAPLTGKIKSDVIEFVRLDDGLKAARVQAKDARDAMTECRERIVQYMKDAGVERLGIKRGQQFLELVERSLKVRASAECVKAKIAELLANKITDPDVIYKEILSCGGTKTEWKLARRSKRAAKPKKTDDAEPPKKKPKKEIAVVS